MSAAPTPPEYEIASQVEGPKASKWVWRSFHRSKFRLYGSLLPAVCVAPALLLAFEPEVWQVPLLAISWIAPIWFWVVSMRRIRREVRAVLVGQKDAIWKIGEEELELTQSSGKQRLAWSQIFAAVAGKHGVRLLTTEGPFLLLHPRWMQTPHSYKFIQMLRKHNIHFDIKDSWLSFD